MTDNTKPITWILIADGRQAQTYIRKTITRRIPLAGSTKNPHYNETEERELVPVGQGMFAEPRESYETGHDRLGRVHESATTARHKSEPRVAIDDEIRQHFAKSVATYLNKARSENAFNRLVLVAPAKFLGELRVGLNKNTKLSVIAEMPKDLVRLETRELANHLEGIA